MEDELLPAASKNQKLFIDWTLDLLIYIVILNLFGEYTTSIYFDNFTVTIFVALVLKILLFLIFKLEHKISHFFKSFESRLSKTLNIVISISILFLSKFVILEVIDVIFKEKVEIYGFIALIFLIIAMIATRKIIEYVYKKL